MPIKRKLNPIKFPLTPNHPWEIALHSKPFAIRSPKNPYQTKKQLKLKLPCCHHLKVQPSIDLNQAPKHYLKWTNPMTHFNWERERESTIGLVKEPEQPQHQSSLPFLIIEHYSQWSSGLTLSLLTKTWNSGLWAITCNRDGFSIWDLGILIMLSNIFKFF